MNKNNRDFARKSLLSFATINGARLVTVCGALLVSILGAGTASGTTLYAGVEHSDYLAPVQEEHANGINQRLQQPASQQEYQLAVQQGIPQPQFENPQDGHLDAYHSVPRLAGNTSYLKTPEQNVEWFMIPKWMGGVWHKQGDLTVSYHDLRTGRFSSMSAWTQNEMTITWGHQYDSEGNIWHADILPLEKDGYSKGKLARFMMNSLTCEHESPQQLVTRARYVVTETYQGTAMVAEMFQQESLNDYTLLADGEMENCSSNRIYSSQGQPLREGSLITRLQKQAAFQPVASQSNIDLSRSLNAYLASKGLHHLMTRVQ